MVNHLDIEVFLVLWFCAGVPFWLLPGMARAPRADMRRPAN